MIQLSKQITSHDYISNGEMLSTTVVQKFKQKHISEISKSDSTDRRRPACHTMVLSSLALGHSTQT